MPTVSEAINLVNELKMLAAEGGFNLTKWTSTVLMLSRRYPIATDPRKPRSVCWIHLLRIELWEFVGVFKRTS